MTGSHEYVACVNSRYDMCVQQSPHCSVNGLTESLWGECFQFSGSQLLSFPGLIFFPSLRSLPTLCLSAVSWTALWFCLTVSRSQSDHNPHITTFQPDPFWGWKFVLFFCLAGNGSCLLKSCMETEQQEIKKEGSSEKESPGNHQEDR